MGSTEQVVIQKRRLALSNLEKIFYPEVGFTKAQVIDYYVRVAPVVLPHLKGRPLTLKRYPNGVRGKFFYEKQSPSHRPEWVKTYPIPTTDKVIDFTLADDLPTLVWLANLADLELHTSLALAKNIARPTMMVFDLDPGAPAGLRECCRVALLLRALFEGLGLECYPKVSGGKGLQVYVPLNTPVTYDETKGFSRAVAQVLERENPRLIVSNMKKELRRGKVLVDWSQNDEHKTTVCVYSLRARERPTVSMPVTWDEVEKSIEYDASKLVFEADQALKRIEKKGDLFAGLLKSKQRLPKHWSI